MKFLFKFCIFLTIVFCTQGFDREITSQLNPQCNDCNNSSVTLIYIKAVGPNDTVHNIWDFTSGKPTMMFAVTDKNDTIDMTWNNSLPTSLNFNSTPKYSFGVAIDKICEFNDVNNTGVIDPSNTTCTRCFDTKDIQWEVMELVREDGEVMVKVKSIGFGSEKRNGTIIIKLDYYPYTSYAFELPHLIHTANSSLVDIILENMTMSKDYNDSRFALELLFISTEPKNGSIYVNMRKGLDDEHTPGIFEIIELLTPETSKNGDGGFVQFRPVSYTEGLRDVSTSTEVHIGSLFNGTITKGSNADIFYRGVGKTSLLQETLYVSLGGKGDGYYKRSNYNIWSFTIGYGNPPMEGFSMFVILIISIGLGIPVFLILIGGVYICVRRRTKLNNQPEILVEE